MSDVPTLREEVHRELEIRVKGRYYGHISPDVDEEPEVKKLYLILAGAGCPGCEEAIEAYEKEIASGDIEVHDIQDSEKAMEIVIALGIYALPALVAEDMNGNYMVIDGGV